MSSKLLLCFVLLSTGLCAEAPWRWINMADWHSAEKHTQVWENGSGGWRTKGYNSLQEDQDPQQVSHIPLPSGIASSRGGCFDITRICGPDI